MSYSCLSILNLKRLIRFFSLFNRKRNTQFRRAAVVTGFDDDGATALCRASLIRGP